MKRSPGMTRFLPLTALALLAACQRAPEPANDIAAAPSPTPEASASPATTANLSRHAGKYPLDDVGGSSFLAEPAVRQLVAGVVDDPAIRARVLDRDVTATPIEEVDGRLLSYGCEPHNCGPHNWTIAIRPDGSGGAVCYYDQDANVARWYPRDAGKAPTDGCPSGE
jgi:hypothetical protein